MYMYIFNYFTQGDGVGGRGDCGVGHGGRERGGGGIGA